MVVFRRSPPLFIIFNIILQVIFQNEKNISLAKSNMLLKCRPAIFPFLWGMIPLPWGIIPNLWALTLERLYIKGSMIFADNSQLSSIHFCINPNPFLSIDVEILKIFSPWLLIQHASNVSLEISIPRNHRNPSLSSISSPPISTWQKQDPPPNQSSSVTRILWSYQPIMAWEAGDKLK